MKIDMSAKAIMTRLKIVNQLRKTCLSLAKSSEGEKVMKQFAADKSVQRTLRALGR